MTMNFHPIENAIKGRLACTLETQHQRRSHCVGNETEYNNSEDSSTQFLQMQKNQLVDLQELFQRYCNILPVFGFNSAKSAINFMKSYLLPNVVSERDCELSVIKKANLFVPFICGIV